MEKPPVLGRGTVQALCLVSLALIVYGTLGPVARSAHPWVVAPEHWRWVPAQERIDFNDLITNLAVYVPVGIAFRLLVRRRGLAGWPDFVLGLGLSVGLSYSTELAQQALPARSSNLVDVYVNSFAAGVGCLIAVRVQHVLRRIHYVLFVNAHHPARPWTVLAWIVIGGAAVLMTVPWNPAMPAAEYGLDEPVQLADVRRLCLFGLVGLLLSGAGVMHTGRRLRAVVLATVQVLLVAGVLEGAQAVIAAHTCSLRDVLVAVTGGIAGALIALRLVSGCASEAWPGRAGRARRAVRAARPVARPLVHALVASGLITALVYTGVTALWGDGTFDGLRGEPEVRWIPFQAHFNVPFAHMLADVVEDLTLFASITLLCLLLMRPRGEGVSLILLVGLVGLLEVCRGFLIGRVADTTSLLLALMAWAFTVRIWRGIHPRRPAPLASAELAVAQ